LIVLNLRQYTFPIGASQGKVSRTRHLIGNFEAALLENGEVEANTVFPRVQLASGARTAASAA